MIGSHAPPDASPPIGIGICRASDGTYVWHVTYAEASRSEAGDAAAFEDAFRVVAEVVGEVVV